jgi:hypothetical protein
MLGGSNASVACDSRSQVCSSPRQHVRVSMSLLEITRRRLLHEATDGESQDESAFDAGIHFFDTADVYSGGLSEEITGQALKNLQLPRDDVVVATKVFGETGKGPNSRGATRHHIMNGMKARCEALGIRPGEKLHAIEYRGRIELVPVRSTKSARGSVKGIDTDVPREFDRV